MKKELASKYDHKSVEKGKYQHWLEKEYFKAGDVSKKPYAIVIPPPNVTGKLHLGHAWDTTLQDMIIRYKRMQGYDVMFLTGTDEHGQKIEIKAKEAGIEPKQYVDQVAGVVKNIWDMMDTSYDRFMRTTDEYHEKQVQKIFKKCCRNM